MFLHQNIHKYSRTSPNGHTYKKVDNILIDRRWHLSVLDVQSFRVADCDTDDYLVIAKVRERPAVSKQATQSVDVERFILRKLNELEVRKQYHIMISNRFANLENLKNTEHINRAWENMKENVKTSAAASLGMYKLKKHTYHGLMMNV